MTAILTDRQQHHHQDSNNNNNNNNNSSNTIQHTTRNRNRRTNSNNNNNNNTYDTLNDDAYKAKLFLTIACCWPLALLVLIFASPQAGIRYNNSNDNSYNGLDNNRNYDVANQQNQNQRKDIDIINLSTRDKIKLIFFNVLDRVDILGYGPTHPRLAVVIVGNEYELIIDTYTSILSNTDFNRLFVVCIVVDGKNENTTFSNTIYDMNNGMIPHWHGLRPDYHKKQINNDIENESNEEGEIDLDNVHNSKNNDNDDDDPHGTKVHVLYNELQQGVAQSRKDGVDFIRLLELQHEYNGIKSVDEDLLLLFIDPGYKLIQHNWLQSITNTLIVPPPPPLPLLPPLLPKSSSSLLASSVNRLLHGNNNKNKNNTTTTTTAITSNYDTKQVMKLSNAISFNIDGNKKVPSFDILFQKVIIDANIDNDEDSLSSTNITTNNNNFISYPTPIFNSNGGIIMRLHTYLHLPMQDMTLKNLWEANLDLSFNLWLCGDGIDIIQDIVLTTSPTLSNNNNNSINAASNAGTIPFDPPTAARFAIAWMGSGSSRTSTGTGTSSSRHERYSSSKIDDTSFNRKYYNAYKALYTKFITRKNKNNISKTNHNSIVKDLSYKNWLLYQKSAQSIPSFTNGLSRKCRSFQWYIDTVLSNWNTVFDNITDSVLDDETQQQQRNMTKKTTTIRKRKKKKKVKTNITTTDSDIDNGRMKPIKPLCDECLRIVQKAKPIDISYVNVRDTYNGQHPHMGAYDSNNTNLGQYIHNETSLHTQQYTIPINISQDMLLSSCTTFDNTYRMLHEKVHIDMEYENFMISSSILNNTSTGTTTTTRQQQRRRRAKIFCLVYTTEAGHPRIPAIRETWGKKCDGFMVASTKTDPSIDAVHIPHAGEESYNNIWQKVRSMWSYVYDNYYEKYDWFHIGGDDLFILVENFRQYLESDEIQTASNGGIYLPYGNETIQTPLYLGRRFAYMGDSIDIFNSGGSGYTFNKAALKTLVVDGLPNYFANATTFSEDTIVGRILRKYSIYPYETKDEYGSERYMPFTPGHHYGYRIPQDINIDWYAKYSINIKEGIDHCSSKSVAFHYVKDDAMYRLYALLYKLCPDDTVPSLSPIATTTAATTTAPAPVLVSGVLSDAKVKQL